MMADALEHLERRIKELGDKSSQTLLFLSFALVVVATLLDKSRFSSAQQNHLINAMRWWAGAIFPILVGILPVKEIRERNQLWYDAVRWGKFLLLWASLLCIGFGAFHFMRAIKPPFDAQLKGTAHETVQNAPLGMPKVAATPSQRAGERQTSAKSNSAPDHSSTDYGVAFAVNLLLAIATLVVAIFAVVQAAAAKRSAETAVRSADFAEKAVKASERADVLLEWVEVKLAQTQRLDGDTQVILHFKNFGRTRASNVAFQFYLAVPDAPEFPAPQPTPRVLGPGANQMVPFSPLRLGLTEATFHKIVAGEVEFFFQGRVTYKDVFGVSHSTTCKATFEPARLAFIIDEDRAD